MLRLLMQDGILLAYKLRMCGYQAPKIRENFPDWSRFPKKSGLTEISGRLEDLGISVTSGNIENLEFLEIFRPENFSTYTEISSSYPDRKNKLTPLDEIK